MASPGEPSPKGDSAWRTYAELERVSPKNAWPYAGRQARMLVAGVLAREGLADSARKVLEAARGDARADPDDELLTIEAMVRTTTLKDLDGAMNSLRQYFVKHPEHKSGMAKSQSWWWRDLRADPRFNELVGSAG